MDHLLPGLFLLYLDKNSFQYVLTNQPMVEDEFSVGTEAHLVLDFPDVSEGLQSYTAAKSPGAPYTNALFQA